MAMVTGRENADDGMGVAAYHAGDPPDSRTMETLEKHDIFDYDHDARRVSCRTLPSTAPVEGMNIVYWNMT